MNIIYFIRHGENKANITKEFSYRKIDYPLTLKGRMQSEQTADYFAGKKIDDIFTSPLKRAVETAGYIGKKINREPEIIEEFRELNAGDLEDMPPTEKNWGIHNRVITEWISGNTKYSFPNGENYDEAVKRFVEGLKIVTGCKNDARIIIVGHGGLFTMGILHVCRIADKNEIKMDQNYNCSISEIELEYRDNSLHGNLIRWADYSHLNGFASEFVNAFPEYGKV
jgi:broad specificity phosphatase PhoE